MDWRGLPKSVLLVLGLSAWATLKGVTAVLSTTAAPTQADVEAYIAANKDL